MADTTSIFQLPTEGGISLGITEKEGQRQGVVPPSVSLDQTTINQIVNGLQQASSTGATMLPSRDIPQTTHQLVQDPEVQANYIPRPPKQTELEIEEDIEDMEDRVKNYNKQIKRGVTFDSIYEEIQTPLLLSVLYFLFQLPILRKTLFRFAPMLFLNDGNANLYGLVSLSILYGIVYYLLEKTMRNFNAF